MRAKFLSPHEMITMEIVEEFSFATATGTILLAYWVLDGIARRQTGVFAPLSRVLEKTHPLVLLLFAGAASVWLDWNRTGLGPEVRAFSTAVACLVAYNAATRDLDPTVDRPPIGAQLLILPAALLSHAGPPFLVVTLSLASNHLRFWLHHATFPMRVLQLLAAGSLVAVMVSLSDLFFGDAILPALVFLLVVVQVSHYVITALAKGLLGRSFFSWPRENRLHFLAASAYSWGFRRDIPWQKRKKFVHLVRRFEKPAQWGAFLLELGAPLALLSAPLAGILSLAFAGFHVGVFALAGLLFWDWIVLDTILAAFLFFLPSDVRETAFGVFPFALGLVVLGMFPLRHRLWKPMPLGWFDTPLTARIHWQVVGESGTVYGLYNDFMCPHERLYGRVHGCFFTPKPVLTYHLGEVWKPDLRDAIVSAGPNPVTLATLRERYGILPNSPSLRAHHQTYLQAFFARLNQGAKKTLLPAKVRFFKAPGDQIFYWGTHPPYARQEKVREVVLHFVEEYFDGDELVELDRQEVARFSIPNEAPACEPELSPKALDDYLLGLAAGRLIDLPGFKKNYIDVLSEM